MARNDKHNVWVEINLETKLPIRIIKHTKDLVKYPENKIAFWPRSEAMSVIRKQVVERANWQCERCSKLINWASTHMDEKISRGEGGEISLDNCWALCADCHIGNKPTSEHGNRRPRFGEKDVL